MKTSLATILSVTGVLAAGALAFTVNTSVLDNAVTTADAAPALQADVIALSNFAPSATAAAAPAAATSAQNATTNAASVAVGESTVAAQSMYNIDGVAAITLALDTNSLSVVSVTPVSGYTFVVTTQSNSRIAVALTLGGSVMTFHAEVLDGRIVTSVVAEQPRISNAAPKTRSYDDDNDEDEDGEHEENEHEDEGEDDDD
jgi:hypothetical protein